MRLNTLPVWMWPKQVADFMLVSARISVVLCSISDTYEMFHYDHRQCDAGVLDFTLNVHEACSARS